MLKAVNARKEMVSPAVKREAVTWLVPASAAKRRKRVSHHPRKKLIEPLRVSHFCAAARLSVSERSANVDALPVAVVK